MVELDKQDLVLIHGGSGCPVKYVCGLTLCALILLGMDDKVSPGAVYVGSGVVVALFLTPKWYPCFYKWWSSTSESEVKSTQIEST